MASANNTASITPIRISPSQRQRSAEVRDVAAQCLPCSLHFRLGIGATLGNGFELVLLLVEGREVPSLQIAVDRHAGEVVAQTCLLLNDLLAIGIGLSDLSLGI